MFYSDRSSRILYVCLYGTYLSRYSFFISMAQIMMIFQDMLSFDVT